MSHVLYGSVKITSYDCVAEDATTAASGGGAGAGVGGGGRGSARSRAGAWFGGGFGGGFRGSAAAAAQPQQQQQQHVASLRASAWYSAPHTSRLTPSMANVHELEAGSDGESDKQPTRDVAVAAVCVGRNDRAGRSRPLRCERSSWRGGFGTSFSGDMSADVYTRSLEEDVGPIRVLRPKVYIS